MLHYARTAIAVVKSSDEGRSWSDPEILFVSPTGTNVSHPGFVRTAQGHIGIAYQRIEAIPPENWTSKGYWIDKVKEAFKVYRWSEDQGETWYDPKPTNIFNSKAPVNIKRIPGSDDLLMVWNSHSVLPANRQCGYRLTLSAAISQDGGKTWKGRREIESITPWPERDNKSMGVHKVLLSLHLLPQGQSLHRLLGLRPSRGNQGGRMVRRGHRPAVPLRPPPRLVLRPPNLPRPPGGGRSAHRNLTQRSRNQKVQLLGMSCIACEFSINGTAGLTVAAQRNTY